MSHALILATNCDTQTGLTHQWAKDLSNILAAAGHTSKLLLGRNVTQANLAANAGSADVVIFYGHGEPDRLLAQPTGWIIVQQHVLIDLPTAHLLQRRPTYAVCCHALSVLGEACGAGKPPTFFIGYQVPFGLSYRHGNLFRDVVNGSAIAFVASPAPQSTAETLKQHWKALADQFLIASNPLSRSPDAFLAGWAASTNSQYVGGRP